ncbi:hypothetical protein [Paraburkholderia bryophila]|uniref:Uncharacterized protein n=1 Tax=Paraburkholderia bryophila TaxID=420952 RepID=A0A329CQK4_9BURK|nr:hypothetical protein [Paraburkholderia bryophila]RAS33125.1 hypothetical protein BX591_10742 [Paraburkholderia bryophila]
MKGFLTRLFLAVVLTVPIGWVLGSFDWFWALAKSPLGHKVLGWASLPFEPLDGESYDDPVVAVMLVVSFIIAALMVWGGPVAVRAFLRRSRWRFPS